MEIIKRLTKRIRFYAPLRPYAFLLSRFLAALSPFFKLNGGILSLPVPFPQEKPLFSRPFSFFFRLAVFALPLLFCADPAWSQTEGTEIFARGGDSDLAIAWLQALFHGEPLVGGQSSGGSFAQIAEAIHKVLRVYSVGFLVLAGFLLLYYALMLVAQTAHAGQIAWNRTSKMWAPLRFALVLGLLVPVGSGLNVGQAMIVKLAEQGSALASNAWQSAAISMKGAFAGLVAPRGPDLRHVVLRAVEIETCRAIYNHHYATHQTDEAVRFIGSISGFDKMKATPTAEETWRYANDLHVNPALCGAYRFPAPSSLMIADAPSLNGRTLETDAALPVFGDAARTAAERLSLQAAALAARIASPFAQNAAIKQPSREAEPNLASFLKEQQDLLDARLVGLAKERAQAEERLLKDAEDNGWVAASSVLFELMSKQLFLGALADRSAPAIDPPILGRKALGFAEVTRDIKEKAGLRGFADAHLEKVVSLYEKAGVSMQKARAWLYGGQMKDAELILPSSLDVDDQLAAGSDSERAFALFRRALDSGFASFGVWGKSAYDPSRVSTTALTQDMKEKPIAALVEMGRRYNDLGAWLMGVAGRGFAQDSAIVPAAVYVFVGGLLALAGLALLFLVPLIPLFRFIAGLLTWILLVFEAVVSVPLVALVHMNPTGEGLFSDMAKKAYGLWLSVFIRPFLMVFGFLVGWAAFFLGLLFTHALFEFLTSRLMIVQSDTLTGVRVFFALLYAALAVVITNVSFKGISFFPQRAIEWLGSLIEAGSSPAPIEIQTPAASATGHPRAESAAQILLEASRTGGRETRGGSSGVSGRPATGAARKETPDPSRSPISRESQLFPQYKDKEIPTIMVSPDGTAKAAAGSSDKGAAAAAVQSGKEGAVAVAVAKASVTLKQKGDDEEKPTDLLKEAAEEAQRIKDHLSGKKGEEKPSKPDENRDEKKDGAPSSETILSTEKTEKDG